MTSLLALWSSVTDLLEHFLLELCVKVWLFLTSKLLLTTSFNLEELNSAWLKEAFQFISVHFDSEHNFSDKIEALVLLKSPKPSGWSNYKTRIVIQKLKQT